MSTGDCFIPENSPFRAVRAFFVCHLPTQATDRLIQTAIEVDGDFCENYTHLAIASFVRHGMATYSGFYALNASEPKWLDAILRDPHMHTRALFWKNETALKWVHAVPFDLRLFNNGVLFLRDKVPAIYMDLFDPEEHNAACRVFDGHAQTAFELALCGVRMSDQNLYSDTYDIMAYYNISRRTYRSTLLAHNHGGAIPVREMKKVEKYMDAALVQQTVDKVRFRMLADRMLEICTSLQSLRLPALMMCEILDQSWYRLAALVPLHLKWKLVVAVKHFQR